MKKLFIALCLLRPVLGMGAEISAVHFYHHLTLRRSCTWALLEASQVPHGGIENVQHVPLAEARDWSIADLNLHTGWRVAIAHGPNHYERAQEIRRISENPADRDLVQTILTKGSLGACSRVEAGCWRVTTNDGHTVERYHSPNGGRAFSDNDYLNSLNRVLRKMRLESIKSIEYFRTAHYRGDMMEVWLTSEDAALSGAIRYALYQQGAREIEVSHSAVFSPPEGNGEVYISKLLE